MPIKKNDTYSEFKRIWDGMTYHSMELTKFMGANIADDFFQTDFGRKMQKFALQICSAHAMGCMEMILKDKTLDKMFDSEDDYEPGEKSKGLEDLLRDSLGKFGD